MHAPLPRPPDYGIHRPAEVKPDPADMLADDLKRALRQASRIAAVPAEPAAQVKEELDRERKSSDDLRAATDELNRKKDQPVLERRSERQR